MRVLVCPEYLAVDQFDAVKLAAAVRRYGYEITFYAAPGRLSESLKKYGIPWIEAPDASANKRGWATRLNRIVHEYEIDVVHGYGWRPCLQAAFTIGLRTPLLMSVSSLGVPPFLPQHLPLVVSNPNLVSELKNQGRDVRLLEPAIDMSDRRPERSAARSPWNIGEAEVVVSIITTLSTDLEKLQGVLTAMRVVDELAVDRPIRLLIGGDGEGFEVVSDRARLVNQKHGRTVIQPVGFVDDPGGLYDAADIVLAMRSSAISAMSFRKPVIVFGEGGFWRLLDERGAESLSADGFFGRGGAGSSDLSYALAQVLDDGGRRRELGSFGRKFVEHRYSSDKAAKSLAGIYMDTAVRQRHLSRTTKSLARSVFATARFYSAMRLGKAIDREKWARAGAVL